MLKHPHCEFRFSRDFKSDRGRCAALFRMMMLARSHRLSFHRSSSDGDVCWPDLTVFSCPASRLRLVLVLLCALSHALCCFSSMQEEWSGLLSMELEVAELTALSPSSDFDRSAMRAPVSVDADQTRSVGSTLCIDTADWRVLFVCFDTSNHAYAYICSFRIERSISCISRKICMCLFLFSNSTVSRIDAHRSICSCNVCMRNQKMKSGKQNCRKKNNIA